jgi:hypothetical protein
VTGTKSQRRLALLNFVLEIVNERLKTFTTTLISEGKTSSLIHGYISFFKHVFADL